MRISNGVIGPLLIGVALLCGGAASAQKLQDTSTWVKDGTTPPSSTSLIFWARKAASPVASGKIGVVLAEGGNLTEGTWQAAGEIVSVTLTGKPEFLCTLSGLSASSFSLAGCTLSGKYTKE